jgi:hypothetical protein
VAVALERDAVRIEGDHEMTRDRKNQRGVALVIVAVFLVVMFGFAAVGIDIARLAHTATEVQTVADTAARAGALGLAANAGAQGTGVARAHLIASRNYMNGALADDNDPNVEVDVDEGFIETATGNFQCCTPMTSRCCLSGLDMGDWSCTAADAGRCAAGRSAALAMPATTVDNILAGVFDFMNGNGAFAATVQNGARPNATTVVEKIAVAAPFGPNSGCRVPSGCTAGDWSCYCSKGVAPCLPIAAPSCQFPPGGCNSNSCLPALKVSPNGGDSAAWTSYGSANTNDIRSIMDKAPLCNQPGSPTNPAVQSVGSASVNVTNGQLTSAWNALQCIWQNRLGCNLDGSGNITSGTSADGRVFSVPVFDMGANCTTSMSATWPLIGFATVRIDTVTVQGNTKVANITTLFTKSDQGGGPGAACFGTDCKVTLAH